MSLQFLVLVSLFLPLLAAAAIGLYLPLRKSGRPAGYLSVSVAGLSLAASASVLFRQLQEPAEVLLHTTVAWLPEGTKTLASLGLHVDGISASMLVVVTLVAFCVQLFSLGYMADEPPAAFGRYFAYQSLFIFTMVGLVIAPNLLQLFLCWELVGLVSYLLIGFYFKKPSAARAAVKAFWITKFADIGLVMGLIVLYTLSGSFDWDPATITRLGTQGATVVSLLLFFAVMGKSAQFPLHIWLPDAMEGPTPVSALLHAATMVAAGVYLIARAYPLFEAAPVTLEVMAYVGGFTAFFAAVIAVIQTDIKRVLAYSTCSQLGYMVAAMGTGTLMGGFFHLTTHAFFKALLFLAAGSMIHAVHSNEMADMGGLWTRMKGTSIVFIIGALALAGFPGFAGFFSKELILESLHESGFMVPYLLAMGAAFLTAFYMTRVIFLAIFGKPSDKAAQAHESPLVMLVPLVILAALAVGVGFFGGTFASLYGQRYAFHVSATGLAATGLGLAGIALGAMTYGKRGLSPETFDFLAPVGRFIRYGAVDRTAVWGFHHVILVVARAIGWFDRYIIDGLINLVAWLFVSVAQVLRTTQTGKVGDYLYAVLVGLILLSAAGWVVQ